MQIVKVSPRTYTARLAGAIAGITRSGDRPVLQAMGAKAIDKAVRAMIRANLYLSQEGLEFACVPRFAQIETDGAERTAVQFVLEVRPLAPAADGEGDRAG